MNAAHRTEISNLNSESNYTVDVIPYSVSEKDREKTNQIPAEKNPVPENVPERSGGKK